MTKFCQYLLFLTFVNALSAYSQEIVNPPVEPNTAFISGENLVYQIKYGFITAGETQLSLKAVNYQNKQVFYSHTTAKTTGFADKLYGVKDIYESWFDKETNLPYKQARNINEGRYKKYNEVTYNRNSNTVYSKLSGTHPVPEKILDLSSTLYYIRRVNFSNFKEGDVILVNMYFSDEIFPFRFIYKGKEVVKTKFGKISCLKICPVVEVGRMFKKPDDVTIWLTDDRNRIPALIQMDIKIVGIVNLKLMTYENVANPPKFEE